MSIVGNLAGGWLIMWIAMVAFPDLHEVALESGSYYIGLGTTWRAFALAVIGGFVITLMTHMQHSTEADGVRLVPAVSMGFLLAAGKLNHAIVASLLVFAALQVGAPFGYGDWLQMLALSVAGNMVGGLGLVTVLRLLQVPHKLAAERDQNEPGEERHDTEPEG